jgi:dolichol-phosphate mannosyltransferase
MRVSLVIPTYNEAENIAGLIEKLIEIFEREKIDGEIIVVDDSSPDGTGEIAEELARKYANLKVIHRKSRLGIGSAYKDGFKVARGNIVFQMDADFSHDPDEIPRLLSALRNADLVLGSRYVKGGKIVGWSWLRRLISWGANFLSNLFLRLEVRDLTSGYRAWRKEALERVELAKIRGEGYAFQLEILWRARKKGLRIKEIPIVFVDRKLGRSKLGLKDIPDYFLTILRLMFTSP